MWRLGGDWVFVDNRDIVPQAQPRPMHGEDQTMLAGKREKKVIAKYGF